MRLLGFRFSPGPRAPLRRPGVRGLVVQVRHRGGTAGDTHHGVAAVYLRVAEQPRLLDTRLAKAARGPDRDVPKLRQDVARSADVVRVSRLHRSVSVVARPSSSAPLSEAGALRPPSMGTATPRGPGHTPPGPTRPYRERHASWNTSSVDGLRAQCRSRTGVAAGIHL